MKDVHLLSIKEAVAQRQLQEREREEREKEIAASMEESKQMIHDALSVIVLPLTEACIAEIKSCGTYAQCTISYDHSRPECMNGITLIIGGSRIGVYPEMWTHACNVTGLIRIDIFKAHANLDRTVKVEVSNMNEDSFSELLTEFTVGALTEHS